MACDVPCIIAALGSCVGVPLPATFRVAGTTGRAGAGGEPVLDWFAGL